MAFSPRFLDELRARVGLADVISRRVKLTRKGREHLGLCPFHKEKTPSFTVNEEKGFYHCFGCQAHGSAIDFVMNTEGLAFPEAVKRLAEEAGLEVPADTPEERQRDRQRQTLYEVMEKAVAFFESRLKGQQGAPARQYLKKRGVGEAFAGRFRLGFAPDSRGQIKDALAGQGIPEEQMVEAGLLIRPEDASRDTYDRFRGRLMFPIADRRGRPIAFGGRILDDQEAGRPEGPTGSATNAPKYLNSPETPLFHKGRVLYGLDQAQAPARKASSLIVTEGYMDVIALAQAGFENSVAPLGTALTEEQILELWRIVPEPVLCFDGDAAGRRAAARAAERALPIVKAGFGLRFAVIEGGEDPDSLIKRAGAEAMKQVLASAAPLSDVLWRIETGGRTPTTPEERASLQKRMEEHVRRIGDSTVRAHFRRGFNDRIWLKRQEGRAKSGWTPSMQIDPGARTSAHIDPVHVAQQTLVSIILNHPDLFHQVEEQFGSIGFSDRPLDSLRQALISMLSGEPGFDVQGLKEELLRHGLEGALSDLHRNAMLRRHKLIRPEASNDDVMETWNENIRLLQKVNFESEIEDRIQAEDLSEDGLRRRLELKRAELGEWENGDGSPPGSLPSTEKAS